MRNWQHEKHQQQKKLATIYNFSRNNYQMQFLYETKTTLYQRRAMIEDAKETTWICRMM